MEGNLSMPIFPFIGLSWPEPPVDAQKIYMNVGIEDRTNIHQRAMWGTTNSKLQNMIEGVHFSTVIPIYQP